ncbi:ALF repeat-containing protein [Streptomyces monomycini]|uniref:ALF repeat-containing protein n=1 Tax=Streptomyces monomycini TaxID=371720 RepID=UPI00067CBEA1|nr:ALF repeat-containing protein [Streptomyces monomycini]
MHTHHTNSARVRRTIARGVVTATVLAAVTGLVAPMAAVAATPDGAPKKSGRTTEEILREIEKARAERAARQARAQVLSTVGIPNRPDLVELGDTDFLRALAEHPASGPEVRAAAVRALNGGPAGRQEFMANGAREAHWRDVEREIKEVQEQLRKDAERPKEIAARKKTAALFDMVASEAMLGLSDDAFLRELLRGAPAKTRATGLYAEGLRVSESSDPAAWKEFIHTGAHQAYVRDFDEFMKKRDEADRKRAQ